MAVLYSGWKLKANPSSSTIDVFWNPLAADACMKPRGVQGQVIYHDFKGVVTTSPAAWRRRVEHVHLTLSPGFMSSVCAFGMNVAKSA